MLELEKESLRQGGIMCYWIPDQVGNDEGGGGFLFNFGQRFRCAEHIDEKPDGGDTDQDIDKAAEQSHFSENTADQVKAENTDDTPV